MVISSLKELDKLMLLCRKRKVLSIKIDNIEFRLDDQQETHRSVQPTATSAFSGITEDTKIDTPDSLTEEQQLMWSVVPGAGEDN